MSNPSAFDSGQPQAAENQAGNPREHSETAAEGTDGLDLPELRIHSQAAAEGPDD